MIRLFREKIGFLTKGTSVHDVTKFWPGPTSPLMSHKEKRLTKPSLLGSNTTHAVEEIF